MPRTLLTGQTRSIALGCGGSMEHPTAEPGHDPIAARLRQRRRERGLTLDQLARVTSSRVPVSPSYISLIENGRKVPDERIAVALAHALGDDERIYRAWVRALKRADIHTTLTAAAELRSLIDQDLAA